MGTEELMRHASGTVRTAAKDSDRIQAMRLPSDFHGMWAKQLEVGGPGEFSHLTDEQLQAEIDRVLENYLEAHLEWQRVPVE